jgi:hypothetical protein
MRTKATPEDALRFAIDHYPSATAQDIWLLHRIANQNAYGHRVTVMHDSSLVHRMYNPFVQQLEEKQ